MTIEWRGAAAVACTVLVAACSSSGGSSSSGGRIDAGQEPASRLVTLNVDGSIPDQGISESGTRGRFSDLRRVNGRLSGFAYQYGREEGTNRFLGVAGVAPTTDPGAPPTAATATYTGDYALTYVDRDGVDSQRGEITLNADFENGDLRGRAGGLVVDGTISGQIVGGTATYRSVDADMSGVIGTERAVTAFAGDTSEAVLVGGINAEATR